MVNALMAMGGGSGEGGQVTINPEDAMAMAKHHGGLWEEDAKKAMDGLDELTLSETSFSDTEGGRTYGGIYSSAQTSYQEILKAVHKDLVEAKESLIAAAKVSQGNDEGARERLEALNRKWSDGDGFAGHRAEEKAGGQSQNARDTQSGIHTDTPSGGDGATGDPTNPHTKGTGYTAK